MGFSKDIHKVIHRKSEQPEKSLKNQGLGLSHTQKPGLAVCRWQQKKNLTAQASPTYAQNKNHAGVTNPQTASFFAAPENQCKLLNENNFMQILIFCNVFSGETKSHTSPSGERMSTKLSTERVPKKIFTLRSAPPVAQSLPRFVFFPSLARVPIAPLFDPCLSLHPPLPFWWP